MTLALAKIGSIIFSPLLFLLVNGNSTTAVLSFIKSTIEAVYIEAETLVIPCSFNVSKVGTSFKPISSNV